MVIYEGAISSEILYLEPLFRLFEIEHFYSIVVLMEVKAGAVVHQPV